MTSTPKKPTPETVFTDFLARLDAGVEETIEDLCSQHPGWSIALLRLWERQQSGVKLVEEVLAYDFAERSIFAQASPAEALPFVIATIQAGDTVGDYRVLEPLGRGGMGQVWVAEQLSLKRRVALKLVLPERISEEALALFAREARAGGRLAHPGIVAIHDHGTTSEGVAWIAMELVEGARTIRDFLDEMAKRDDLPRDYFQQVAHLVAQIAEALQSAHESGVIHRDIKPQNLLITPDGEPKVTDFGLARITDETAISRTGDFAGTCAYMSPEQVTAKRMGLDHRTDIFSLGIVLYEMLALRRPFQGETAFEIAEKIVTVDPPDLRRICPEVPKPLVLVCRKALQKRKDRRYSSMTDFANDLKQPIPARKHLRSYWRSGSRGRQKPRRLGLTWAAAGLLAGAGIGLLLPRYPRESGQAFEFSIQAPAVPPQPVQPASEVADSEWEEEWQDYWDEIMALNGLYILVLLGESLTGAVGYDEIKMAVESSSVALVFHPIMVGGEYQNPFCEGSWDLIAPKLIDAQGVHVDRSEEGILQVRIDSDLFKDRPELCLCVVSGDYGLRNILDSDAREIVSGDVRVTRLSNSLRMRGGIVGDYVVYTASYILQREGALAMQLTRTGDLSVEEF